MGRYSPTTPLGPEGPNIGDEVARGITLYLQLERQKAAADAAAAQQERIGAADARAAERHEVDLFEGGYRRGRVPQLVEPATEGARDFGGLGLQRGTDPGSADPFAAGLGEMQRRRPQPVMAEPDPAGEGGARRFTPGQFIPGLGFQVTDPFKVARMGPARDPMVERDDPRFERVTDDLYRAPRGPEANPFTVRGRRFGTLEEAVEAERAFAEAGRRSVKEDEPLYTPADLMAAGLTEQQAALAARDPVLARELLREGRREEDPEGFNVRGQRFADIDEALAATRRFAEAGRAPPRPATERQPTPTERRTRILTDAKSILRAMDLQPGQARDDPGIVRVVARSLAQKYGTTEAETFGFASQAAQDVKVERDTPIGSSTRAGSPSLAERLGVGQPQGSATPEKPVITKDQADYLRTVRKMTDAEIRARYTVR